MIKAISGIIKSTSLSLESFLTGSQLILSTTKINPTYTGNCMEVLRNNDAGQSLNVGFVGNDFDMVSYDSYIGTNNANIRTFYDQSGNSRHHSQLTGGNRPVLKDGTGKILSPNGKQSIAFNGTSQSLISSAVNPNPGNGGAVSIITIIGKNSNVFSTIYNQGNTTAYWNYGLCTATGAYFRNTDNDWLYNGANTIPNTGIQCLINVSNGSTSTGYLNGVNIGAVAQGTSSSTAATPFSEIGKRANFAGEYFNGQILTVMILSRAISLSEVSFITNYLLSYY